MRKVFLIFFICLSVLGFAIHRSHAESNSLVTAVTKNSFAYSSWRSVTSGPLEARYEGMNSSDWGTFELEDMRKNKCVRIIRGLILNRFDMKW
jgi:hypothetical protein